MGTPGGNNYTTAKQHQRTHTLLAPVHTTIQVVYMKNNSGKIFVPGRKGTNIQFQLYNGSIFAGFIVGNEKSAAIERLVLPSIRCLLQFNIFPWSITARYNWDDCRKWSKIVESVLIQAKSPDEAFLRRSWNHS